MIQAITLLIIGALVAIDQIIKAIVVKYLAAGGSAEALFGLLRFRYVENTGAAFSSMEGQTGFLTFFTVAVIIAVLFVLLTKKIQPGMIYWCLTCVVAGGIGNAIDRIARGFVVDYIEPTFVNFAVFNFADCLITVGAILLIVVCIYDMIKENKKYLADDKKEESGKTDE